MAPPNRAERPVAVLSAPDALGPCDGVVVDASGSTGGRSTDDVRLLRRRGRHGRIRRHVRPRRRACSARRRGVRRGARAGTSRPGGDVRVYRSRHGFRGRDVDGVRRRRKDAASDADGSRARRVLARDATIRTDAAGGGGARAQSRVRGVERVGRRRGDVVRVDPRRGARARRVRFSHDDGARRAPRHDANARAVRAAKRPSRGGDVPLATQDDARRQPRAIFHGYVCHVGRRVESARRRRRRGNVRRRVPQRAARPARGRARPGRRDGRAWGAVPVHVRVVVRHARGRRVRREPRQRSRVVSLERADGDVSRGDVSRRGRVRLHRERRARTRRRRT